MLNSYGSIYQLGHVAVEDIFHGECELSEKVDGSSLSFALIDGELQVRSKNKHLYVEADQGMFGLAIKNIQTNQHLLTPGYVYRSEFLMKPKHNTLAYSRIPKNNIIVYDIERSPGSSDFLRWEERNAETLRIGFEPIPVLYTGQCNLDHVKACLDLESVLGGVKVEGVVVKNYAKFTEDKKVAKAKYVNPEFQEKNNKEWKKENPTRKDIITELIEAYAVEARWQKAVQHLRDDGILEGSPRDIGNLIKAAQEDLKSEEEYVIKDILFKHFVGQILRGSIAGLPTWYKEQLAEGNIWVNAPTPLETDENGNPIEGDS